jgi:hypothetical protein
MMIIRIRVMELLCKAVIEHALVLKYLVLCVRGCLCYVLSYQALNGAASQGPDRNGAYPALESPPGMTTGGLGQVTRRIYNG